MQLETRRREHGVYIYPPRPCAPIDRITVLGTDALPEDSRITRPMIVVHIVDSSTGRYLTKKPPPKASFQLAGGCCAVLRVKARSGI